MRLPICFVVLALPPTVVLADLGLSFARGYTTSSSLWIAVAVLAGTWLAFAAREIATARRRAGFRRRGPALAAAAVSLCLTWVLLEVVLGLVFAPRASFHLAPANFRHRFAPDPTVLRGLAAEAHYTTNARGIRGPDWPDRSAMPRWLCVGGSTTECLYLDDAETWPRRCADLLAAAGAPAWIGDVGRSGYATAEHLRLFEDEALLREVDGVVLLVGINDLQRAMKGRPLAVPFGVRPLFERSAAFLLFDRWYNERRTRRRHLDETADGANYARRRHERASAAVTMALPDLSAARADYRRNLEAIAERAASLGLRVVFATQPVLWSEQPTPADEATFWLGTFGDGTRPPTAWLAQEMAAFNAVLRDVARARHAVLVDLDVMNGREPFFYDDCHFTREGAAVVAERVAAALPR